MSTNEELVLRAEQAAAQVAKDKAEIQAMVTKLEEVQAPSIAASKEDIKQALTEKGQTVDDTVPFSEYGNKVRAIQSMNIQSMDFYKCASVDTTSKAWTGYKAVLTDGVYSFEDTATTGLTYGTAYTPSVYRIYSADATVAVSGLYEGGDPTLVFHAPLTGRSAVAETGQVMTEIGTVKYTTFEGRECAYFNTSSYIETAEYNLPIGGVPFTLFARVAFTGDISGFNHLLKFGEHIGFRAWSYRLIPYTNTGDTIWKTDITTDVFYAAAATYDGSIFTLFVDGKKISESEPALNPISGNIRIGTGHANATGSGYVSDMRIYNRCLSAEEIAELANN